MYPEEDRALVARRQHGQAPPAARRQRAQGGIVSKESPIHLSNVAHVDPKTGKPTRVGFKMLDDGRKVRFAKKSGRSSMSEAGKASQEREGRQGRARRPKARGEAPRRAATQAQVSRAGEERDPSYVPRFKKRYNDVIASRADEAVRLQERDAGAAHRQDRAQHRRRRRRRRHQEDPDARRTI